MINKDSLIILTMLYMILIDYYDFKKEGLLTEEQDNLIGELVNKKLGKYESREQEKELMLGLFKKYLEKLK